VNALFFILNEARVERSTLYNDKKSLVFQGLVNKKNILTKGKRSINM